VAPQDKKRISKHAPGDPLLDRDRRRARHGVSGPRAEPGNLFDIVDYRYRDDGRRRADVLGPPVGRCAVQWCVGDDSHDDTAAINTTISAAITNNWPVRFSAGTCKVTSAISIDYAGQATKGFRLISEGATIDGRAIASGPVLQIQCGGGSTGSSTGCFYFKEEGSLFVNASTPAYAVVIG